MKVQPVGSLADHDSFLGEGDAWIGGVAEVGHEHAFTHCSALGVLHVLHVNHGFGESLIEDPRLDFERNLRTLQPVFQAAQSGLRAGSDVGSVDQRQEPSPEYEDGEHAKEIPYAYSACPHGS